jgi:hypothetical protein
MLHDAQWDLRSRIETTGVDAAEPGWRAGGGDAAVLTGGSADFAGSVMTGARLNSDARY